MMTREEIADYEEHLAATDPRLRETLQLMMTSLSKLISEIEAAGRFVKVATEAILNLKMQVNRISRRLDAIERGE